VATDDICKTETEDIAAFLPEPIKSKRGGMIFPVSF
jgi:adenosylmethionine-8-amino-7-oxononanoate aminotransferase